MAVNKLALVLAAALAMATIAESAKVYRHYNFYTGAPANALTVRLALVATWNKAHPTQKVLKVSESFQDSADAKDPKYAYNYGGYFETPNRAAFQAFDAWQHTQAAYTKTFGGLPAARFNTLI